MITLVLNNEAQGIVPGMQISAWVSVVFCRNQWRLLTVGFPSLTTKDTGLGRRVVNKANVRDFLKAMAGTVSNEGKPFLIKSTCFSFTRFIESG